MEDKLMGLTKLFIEKGRGIQQRITLTVPESSPHEQTGL
jgi:hypothetical protein